MLYTPIIRRKLSSTLRNGRRVGYGVARRGKRWFPFKNTITHIANDLSFECDRSGG